MLGYDPFFFGQLRKYQMVFGTLFNEIAVTRPDGLLRIPIHYAAKDKLLARVFADPNIDRKSAVTLPVISFYMSSITHNTMPQLRSNTRYRLKQTDSPDILEEQLMPVPYDLHFTMWVYTKYVEDGNQIIEQMLPFFSPQFTATVNMFDDVHVDTQVTLNDVVPEDKYDGAFEDRRVTVWTLNFTLTGYIFGPKRQKPLIKFANVNFVVSSNTDIRLDANTPPIDRVTVQPGMNANGDPTTNIALTVDYHTIQSDDNWDYIVEIAGSLIPGDIGLP